MFTLNPDLYQAESGTEEPNMLAQQATAGGGGLSNLLDWDYRKELYKKLFSSIFGSPEKVEQFLYGIGPQVRGALEKVPTPVAQVSGEGINFTTEPGFKRMFDLVEQYLGKATPGPAPVTPNTPSESRFTNRQWRPTPPPPAAPAEGTPAVSPLPAPPTPGTPVGTPQYTAPEPTPAPTPPVVTPPTAEPVAAAPEMPDFSQLVKPWKSSVNYEEELMKIFKESMPTAGELPQSKFREPKTVREFFSDFAKYAGIAMAGKDPWEYKHRESKEAQATADKETEYVLKRSAQLANLRIAGLTEKMRREDTERSNRSSYLQNLATAQPEIMKQPYYQTAVASVAGIPAAEVETFLKKHIDPKTGLLESFYRSPLERAQEQKQAMFDLDVKIAMDATGYPIDRAKFMVASGKDDPGAWLMSKYQRALQAKDPVAMKQAVADIQEWKRVNAYDPSRDEALTLLKDMQDPKVDKSISTIFTDAKSKTYLKQYLFGVAMGAKDFRPPVPADIHFDEAKVLEANSAIGNPAREKAFLEKHGVHPRQAVAIYMKWVKENSAGAAIDVPQPFKTIRTLFPEYAGKVGDVYMSDPNMMEAVNRQLTTYYAKELNEINRTLPKKKPITPQEMYELTTLMDRRQDELLVQRIRQLWADRKLPIPEQLK